MGNLHSDRYVRCTCIHVGVEHAGWSPISAKWRAAVFVPSIFGPPDFSLPPLDRIPDSKRLAAVFSLLTERRTLQTVNLNSFYPDHWPSSRFSSPRDFICVWSPQLFFLYGSIRIRRWWILFYSLLILELKSCWGNCIFILSKLQQIFSYKIHDLAWLVNELVCFSTPSSFKFIRGKSNI